MTALPFELEKSIIILKRINTNLKINHQALEYIAEQMQQEFRGGWNEEVLSNLRVCLYTAAHMAMVWHVSFMDEYNRAFNQAAIEFDKARCIQLRKSCEQYVDLVKELFSDLKTIRNTIVAHGYRWKNNVHLEDKDINKFMTEVTGKEISGYYQLCRIPDQIITAIEKEYGTVNEDLILADSDDVPEPEENPDEEVPL